MSRKRPPAAPPAIPGFAFISVLGSGGFSDVYLYEQDRPRRKVAVKVLTADLKTDGARRRFESEANLMAQLSSHPYIVTIYEAEVTAEGHSYLAMEYCSRPSLDVRSRRGKFSVDEALSVGIQVASAVETAHRAGIVHRDIKPANILVTDYNRPALTDFGISGTVDSELDDDGGMSIPWSPPESFTSGPNDGVRADIWALGATIYTLLAGHSPFVVPGGDNSQRELISRINSSPLRRLGRADVPETLDLVLATAMSKSPASRYRSAKAFARALMRVQTELNLSVTPFEVQEDLVVEELDLDDNIEETRIRSVVAIDPDSQPSSPTFPTAFRTGNWPGPGQDLQGQPPAYSAGATGQRSGSTTGLTQNGGTVPSDQLSQSALPTTGAAPTVPGSQPSFTSMVTPTEWADQRQGAPGLSSHEPSIDTTVHRRDYVDPSTPAPVQTSHVEAVPSKKRLWLGLGSGAVLVVAAAVTAVILMTSGVPKPENPTPSDKASVPPAVILAEDVPPVSDLTSIPDDGGASWSWTNPDPQPGDFYLWAPVSAVSTGDFKPIKEEDVFVAFNSSSESCISVKLVRKSGKESPETRKCFPD